MAGEQSRGGAKGAEGSSCPAGLEGMEHGLAQAVRMPVGSCARGWGRELRQLMLVTTLTASLLAGDTGLKISLHPGNVSPPQHPWSSRTHFLHPCGAGPMGSLMYLLLQIPHLKRGKCTQICQFAWDLPPVLVKECEAPFGHQAYAFLLRCCSSV